MANYSLSWSVMTGFAPSLRSIPSWSSSAALQRLSCRGQRAGVRRAAAMYKLESEQQQQQRRSANYPPTMWDDSYIQSLPTHFMEEDVINQAMKLKEVMRNLLETRTKLFDQLQLIDNLQQLGVSYHFEKEIMDALTTIHKNIGNIKEEINDDLYSTSLLFRLLREHGFCIPTDIFSGIKEDKCMQSAILRSDIKAVLSLYEASFLATEGEHHMDQARNFAAFFLRDHMRSSIEPTMKKHLAYALELPMHWRMQRIHARWFIDMYERQKDMNPSLLKLAKLDFNMVQGIYKQELKELSRWWVSLDIPRNLKFTRDRLVENYMFSLGCAFEPKFWRTRVAMAKANCLITIIDDVYDVYGTLDELELFTDVIERWDANGIEQLPLYMKISFMALFNHINETAYEILKLKGLNVLPQLRQAYVDLCKSYILEARWYHGGYKPGFEEYLDNAWMSISGHIALTHAYCTSEDLTMDALECFSFYPKEVYKSCMIFRLCDDLATSTAELERGDVLKSIQCYMNKNKATEAMAREHIREYVGSIWKKLNADFIDNSSLESFKKVALNIPRTSQWIYQYGDGIGVPEGETRNKIILVLMEPIQI